MDQNQNPTPATPAPIPTPPANIPPPFTLPSSVTSVPSVNPQAPGESSPVQNPETNPRKKWVKISVIAGVAVVLIGLVTYFGKDFLFKGMVKDIRTTSCVNAPPDGLSGVLEGDFCYVGSSQYSWNGSAWILVVPEEKPAEEAKLPEAEPAVGPEEKPAKEAKPPEDVEGEGELAKDLDRACSDDDYDGVWGECKEGVQSRNGFLRKGVACKGDAYKPQQQACGGEEIYGVGSEVKEGDAIGEAESKEIAMEGEKEVAPVEEKEIGTSDEAKAPESSGAASDEAAPAEEKEIGTSEEPAAPSVDGTGGGEDSASAPIIGVGSGSAASSGSPAPSGGGGGLDYAGTSVGGGGTPTFIVGGTGTESRPTEVSRATEAVRGTQQEASQSGIIEESVSPSVSPDTVAGTSGALHGAYIQGETGPGLLLYPFMLAGANALYFWRKKRKAKR